MRNIRIIFTLLLGSALLSLQGQTLDDARNWYLEGRYADALPIFQQAYSEDSTNASLNQWLGVSLLKTGRVLAAEPYLLFSDAKKIPEAPLYLGEFYAMQYRFEEAKKAFDKYRRANRRNKGALERLAPFEESVLLLQKRLSQTEDIQIIDSLVLPKKEFLSAYRLSQSSGSLQPLHIFFKNAAGTSESVYLNERGDKVYFSKAGAESGLDLFTMDKMIDQFGNEYRLPDVINGEGNQAYPYVMSDGLTMYFASSGHQSLGGYDIYVTRYNLASDTYLTPNQLNMPFNSPFNDYMMAIDEEKGVGWFASDRFQPDGLVCVYTFIPNSQVTLLQSDDLTFLSRRARIASIADSWREGVDYSNKLASARQQSATKQDTPSEFEFVINDKRIYRRLSDFTHHPARSLFSEAIDLQKQLDAVNKELTAYRERIASGGEMSNSTASRILELEKESESLVKQIKTLKHNARNEEIRNLTN